MHTVHKQAIVINYNCNNNVSKNAVLKNYFSENVDQTLTVFDLIRL